MPKILNKVMLVAQTGIVLACGQDGEHCACYHNGRELVADATRKVEDADFIVCWQEPTDAVSCREHLWSNPSPQVPPLANSSGVSGNSTAELCHISPSQALTRVFD